MMDQSVNNAALVIKKRYERFKEPTILMGISTPKSIRNEVSQLDQT
jgi:hypothetical protein